MQTFYKQYGNLICFTSDKVEVSILVNYTNVYDLYTIVVEHREKYGNVTYKHHVTSFNEVSKRAGLVRH